MKKVMLLLFAAICLVGAGCIDIHFDSNTGISLRESNHYYSMKAHFSDSRMREVERYMDEEMGNVSHMSFVNTKIDGQLAFEDHTNFYIRKTRGRLEIELNKEHNSFKSYVRVKEMCEGIKDILGK